ncbi:helix-turn-helix domain-containing protein [Glutamicibacter sp. X7]
MDTDNPITQSIAAQLRARRAEQKVEMKDLATRTGITLVSLSRYLNGKRDIPASTFAIICSKLGLDGGKVLNKAMEEFLGQ